MTEAPIDPSLFETPQPRAAWGARASVGWTALAVLLMLGTQVALVVASALARVLADPKANLEGLAADGRLALTATLVAVPPVLGLVVLLIRARGWRVGPYLGLRAASGGATILAALGLVVALLASDALTKRLDRPMVSPLMAEIVLSAPRWLVVLALVLGAPLVEEILFRGFLYRGLAESPRVGPGLAIGITALAWAGMHWFQFDLYGLATVYLMGLYLGLVRHLTGSTYLTILLHAIANAAATARVIDLARAG